jgi:hypothetical protein
MAKANDAAMAPKAYIMPRQDAAEGAGSQLERAAHGAGDAEHVAELPVAEVQLAQHQGGTPGA